MRYYILTLALFITSLATGQKVSQDVNDQFETSDIVDCIIVLKNQLDLYGTTEGMSKDRKAKYVFERLSNHSAKTQKNISAYLESEEIEYKSFHIFNGFQAYLSRGQVNYLSENNEVAQVVFNEPAKVLEIEKQPESLSRSVAEWGILQIKADSVWDLGYQGEGVIVGGQDTGYDFDNSLLLPKYRGYTTESLDHNYNWHDAIDTVNVLNGDTINDPSVNPCGFLSSEPCDDHGHGTHTMGTMIGSDTINDIGVAPAASWIGCRNMDRGWGKPSTYTECFQWFLAPTDLEGQNPDPTKAPHVIANSWGCPEQEGCNPTNWMYMETVVNNLSAAGTVVVVSAGNSGGQGCGSVSNPAAIFENSFSVGASNDSDGKAGFSSIGPVVVDSSFRIKPDVVAPGVGVRSTYLNEEFRTWNGTSMAGPHVAGAVALIINANPALAGQVDIIKNILKTTAVQLTDSTECLGNLALEVPNFYYGYGRIDVYAAVKLALETTNVNNLDIKNPVVLFPNPNNGDFTIEVDQSSSIDKLLIHDLTGRSIGANVSKNSKNSRSVIGLSKGLYIYTLETNGIVHSGKIVVSN